MVLPWRSRGAESRGETKIPIPLTSQNAAEICRRLENTTANECLSLLNIIKNLLREGDMNNKNCLIQNGIVSSLASCFQRFSLTSEEHALLFLEQVLLILSSLSPLNRLEGFKKMGSKASLNSLVKFLNVTDVKTRQNAAYCVREVIALDKSYVYAFTEIEGACEGLVKIIRDSISSSSIKSSLMAIYRSISCDNKIATRFVEVGLVESITEMIVNNNAEKSVCERCLIILNVISNNEQGRDVILRNALVVPLLVKKILRVSDLATQCAVSILWKLWKKKNGESEDRLLMEAFQVGAFEKLLVVLQIGCEEKTKEKASELLRNLNRCRNEMEKMNCVDSSMHLNYVKKSF